MSKKLEDMKLLITKMKYELEHLARSIDELQKVEDVPCLVK